MVNFQFASVSVLALASVALAHGSNDPTNNKRHAAYLQRMQMRDAAAPTAAVPGIPALSAITSGMPTATPSALFTSFAAGATPPVSGAPPLPTVSALSATKYPTPDVVPPTDSPLLTGWLNAVKAAQIPNWPQTKDGSCESDPQLIPNAGTNGSCWWTCGGCTRDTDVTACPTPNVWGVTYDDGPSDYTPQLLNDLNDNNLKATFYAVGSRVFYNPKTLQAEYMLGHQIAVHTWSHPALTSLTNEQIVAELGWTMIVIKEVLGVTPNTFRPPYGDLDDRVRAVAKAMGLTPSMWTGYGDDEFDTDDWMIPGGTSNGTSSYAAFNRILDLASKLTTGFIVLEHDLYQQTVEMAIGYFLPLAKTRNFTLKSLYECLGQSLASTYIETAGNSTTSSSTTSSGHSSSTISGSGTKATGSMTSTSKPSSSTGSLAEGQATTTPGAATARAMFSGSASLGVVSVLLVAVGAAALL